MVFFEADEKNNNVPENILPNMEWWGWWGSGSEDDKKLSRNVEHFE
jgi:hypothetical protein